MCMYTMNMLIVCDYINLTYGFYKLHGQVNCMENVYKVYEWENRQ